MTYSLSPEDIAFFKSRGYLVIRDLLSKEETENLQRWVQEVHDWKATPDSVFMPYEEVNAKGERVLCRTERYADCHEGLGKLLRSQKLVGVLEQLSGQPMILFKEKINYKLAGSGGFAPHLDAPAYTHIKMIRHLAILMAVDASNMSNGGLEVVNGSHEMKVPIDDDLCVQPEWVAQQKWTPVELEPGQVLIFGSYLAHRSAANNSSSDRKALYATYNRASEGDLRTSYYEDRRKNWPATHMRKPGEDYAEGSLRYGYGSPMLSIDAGRQLIFVGEK